MRRLPHLVFLVPGLALGLAACGSSDSPGGGSTDPGDAFVIGDTSDAGSDTATDTPDPDTGEDTTDPDTGEDATADVVEDTTDPDTGEDVGLDADTGFDAADIGDDVGPECEADDDCEDGERCALNTCIPEDLVCVPDTTRCDGGALFACSDDGTEETEQTCEADTICADDGDGMAECLPIICEPFEIGCLDNETAFVCDSTGARPTPSPCDDGQYCDAGSCRPQVCEPDTIVCDGDIVVACDERGATRTTTACATADGCADSPFGCACVEGACAERVCTPGDRRCVGSATQTCADDGLSWSDLEACGDEELCIEGSCLSRSCEPGSTVCSGDRLLTCNDTGTAREPTDCAAADAFCDVVDGVAACTDWICEPDATRCADTGEVVLACDARGTGEVRVPCEDGLFCRFGACTDDPCDARACDEFGEGETPPDLDGDGLPDCVEGGADPDGDGLPACNDPDSDNDRLTDAREGDGDPDDDGIPNYLDTDSDGDGILDQIELWFDPDGDGTPNYLDLDSDDDGKPDEIERGVAAGALPRDTDRDGVRDYLDTDSDDDGLLDEDEGTCPEGLSNWRDADSDDDGDDDRLEAIAGSDPCDARSTVEDAADFYFELPPDTPLDDPLDFLVEVQQGDVVFNMDATGSMGGEIAALRTAVSTSIVPEIVAELPDTRFGVTRFQDFTCDGHGSGSNVPFALMQRVTSDIELVQSAIDALVAVGGADFPESGYESLYQIATGAGVAGCGADVDPFDADDDFVEGEADGDIGGVGFRFDSLPIVLHVTDALSHDGDVYGGFAATRDDTVDALNGIRARVIGVASDAAPVDQLTDLAESTGAVVLACAWDGDRGDTCAAGQCCTGLDGAGVASDEGMCPLVYRIRGNGTGLDTVAVGAVDALLNYSPVDVRTEVVRDEDEFERSGIDTSLFVASIEAVDFTAGDDPCATTPVLVDFDDDGADDSFDEVTPGTTLAFRVNVVNDFVDPGPEPRYFVARIDVIADEATVVDSRDVIIVVPAAE